MIQIDIVDMEKLVAFWLCFSRWLAIAFQLPIFDNVSVPTLVKILGTLVISYAFFPVVEPHIMQDIQYMGAENFWALTIFYTIVGLIIGYLVKSILQLFVASGSIITQQVGFAAVRYFDPSMGSQVGPFEKLIHWTILIVIITSGALLPMFKGVVESFGSIHIYQLGMFAKTPVFFVEFFKSIFLSAILLAMPVIFSNILIMVILGITARMVPQMNIIMVSFVLNIGLGLLVFAATSNEFFQVGFKIYVEKLGDWFQFIT